MTRILAHFTSLLHRKQCNTQYIEGTYGKHTHIYAQTSKLVTDATPPPWLQSTTMLTSVISCHLGSMFLSCLRMPFCSSNMFFMVYSSTPSVSAPRLPPLHLSLDHRAVNALYITLKSMKSHFYCIGYGF